MLVLFYDLAMFWSLESPYWVGEFCYENHDFAVLIVGHGFSLGHALLKLRYLLIKFAYWSVLYIGFNRGPISPRKLTKQPTNIYVYFFYICVICGLNANAEK